MDLAIAIKNLMAKLIRKFRNRKKIITGKLGPFLNPQISEVLWHPQHPHYIQPWFLRVDVELVSKELNDLGGHFACLYRGFEFYKVKKKCYYFLKRKWKYFYFYHFYSEVFKKSKIAQIYYYDPQSARINLQSPQSDSTP
jgi:hypothetical protein